MGGDEIFEIAISREYEIPLYGIMGFVIRKTSLPQSGSQHIHNPLGHALLFVVAEQPFQFWFFGNQLLAGLRIEV